MIKQIIELLECEDATKEALEAIEAGKSDFTIDAGGAEYRFINTNDIDKIQQEELESDPYILGCFTPWFLAGVLDMDKEFIEDLQKKECFEAIGKMIIRCSLIEKLQKQYVSADGYGHHFAHYDHEEHEISLNDETFHVFRTN